MCIVFYLCIFEFVGFSNLFWVYILQLKTDKWWELYELELVYASIWPVLG